MSITPRKPRLADLIGIAKPKRRTLVTQDGTVIVRGESFPIAGVPIALDERPVPSGLDVTFDGAVPSSASYKDVR